MKTRATSFLLAALAVVSFVLPALAAASDEIPEETIPEEVVETPEIEEVHSALHLDGVPVDTAEYEIRGGVCYVTVRSFVSMLDPEAMVEEENGTVSVSASTVTQIIPLYPEADDPAAGEGVQDAGDPADVQDGEPALGDDGMGYDTVTPDTLDTVVDGGTDPAAGPDMAGPDDVTADDSGAAMPADTIPAAADVVTADLDLQAALWDSYVVANGRYLYAKDGLIDLNGCVAAPVRVLAQVFNLTVDYDWENEWVLLGRQEGAEPYLASGDATYDGDTLYWLSRIIHAESGNQSLEGKIAVGNVVMNRVNNPRFPNDIESVIFQKNQFTPAVSGSIYREPNWESVVAAKLVMDGAQVTPDALFFNAAGLRSYASRTRTYVTTIGDHAFYK